MSPDSTKKFRNRQSSSKLSLSFETIILYVFLYFQKILGLVPFTVQQSISTRRIGNVRIPLSPKLSASRYDRLYNFVLIVLFIGSNIMTAPALNGYFALVDPLVAKIEFVIVLMGSTVLLLLWGIVASRQNDVIKIYRRLENIEDGMHMFRDIHHPEPTEWRICRIYLLNSILWFFHTFVDYIGPKDYAPELSIPFFIPFFVTNWFMIQYASILIIIEARMISLNRSFILLTKSSMGPIFSNFHESQINPEKSINEKFFALRQVYTVYSEVWCEISKYYSLPILLIITSVTIGITNVSYYLIEVFFYPVNTHLITSTILYGLGMTLLTSSIVIVSMAVTRVTNQMKETSGPVYRELSQSIVSYVAKDELRNFSVELLHRKVDFTAFGLFSLDCSLIKSIFGTVLTYLVIMIQYKVTAERSSIVNVQKDN